MTVAKSKDEDGPTEQADGKADTRANPMYGRGDEVEVIEGVGVEEGDTFTVKQSIWDSFEKTWQYTLEGWMGMVEEGNLKRVKRE